MWNAALIVPHKLICLLLADNAGIDQIAKTGIYLCGCNITSTIYAFLINNFYIKICFKI